MNFQDFYDQFHKLMPEAGRESDVSPGCCHVEWPRDYARAAIEVAMRKGSEDFRQFLARNQEALCLGGSPALLQLAHRDLGQKPPVGSGTLWLQVGGSSPAPASWTRELMATPGPLLLHPDGLRAVVGQELWDLEEMVVIGPLPNCRPLSLFQDGWRLALAQGNHLILHDLDNGERASRLLIHPDQITALQALGDHHLACAGRDRSLKIWDLSLGEIVAETEVHWGPIPQLASDGGGQLFSICLDGCLRSFCWETGKQTAELDIGVPIASLALDLPRVHLALVDGAVESWDWETRQRLAHRQSACAPLVHLAARGECLAASGNDGKIYVWDPQPRVLSGCQGTITGLGFEAGGSLLSLSSDRRLRRWSMPALSAEDAQPPGHHAPVTALAGDLYSCSEDGQILRWDPGPRVVRQGSPLSCLAVRQEHILSGGPEGLELDGARLSGEPALAVAWHSELAVAVLESPDGPCLAAWKSGLAAVAERNSWQEVWRAPLPWTKNREVWCLASYEAGLLVSGQQELACLVEAGKVRRLKPHKQGYLFACLSGQGIFSIGYHHFALSHLDGSLQKRWKKPFQCHTTQAAAHPLGQPLVALWYGFSHLIALLSLEDQSIRYLGGHLEDVRQVVWSPDGSLLYSMGEDHTVRAFRVLDGELIATWADGGQLTCLHALPRGVAVGTAAGEVLRLELHEF